MCRAGLEPRQASSRVPFLPQQHGVCPRFSYPQPLSTLSVSQHPQESTPSTEVEGDQHRCMQMRCNSSQGTQEGSRCQGGVSVGAGRG